MQNSMVMLIFSPLDEKYQFRANLIEENKVVILG